MKTSAHIGLPQSPGPFQSLNYRVLVEVCQQHETHLPHARTNSLPERQLLNPIPPTQHLLRSLLPPWRCGSSPLPRFILDANHSWLATNKAWLSHYPNVTQKLCSPEFKLWTSSRCPSHLPPADLFANLTISNTDYSSPSWYGLCRPA
jgi:hypothetical protein